MKWPLVLCAVLLAGTASAQSTRPAHDWSRFAEGTRVVFRVEAKTPQGSSQGRYAQVLGRIDAEGYRLDELFDLGDPIERAQEWELPEAVGEETLQIAGRERRCTLWRASGREGDALAQYTAWVEEPGGVAIKMVKGGPSGDADLTWLVVGEEAIAVPAGEFRAVRVEGTFGRGEDARRVISWLSPEVPGSAVKTVLEGAGSSMSFELVEFGPGR